MKTETFARPSHKQPSHKQPSHKQPSPGQPSPGQASPGQSSPGQSSLEELALEELTLDECEAILICLSTKRFVVVRTDQPENLWPIAGGWDKIRDLKPGDEVIYKGDRTTVRALDTYR
jgi:hypothetical protein